VDVIDLRVREPGCTGHPIVRLNTLLREVKGKGRDIRVIVNPEDIPFKALKLTLKKHGYEIISVKEKESYLEVEASPKR